ncbi:MAG: hypothetical protein J5636_00755 [Clostridiales bacterium]|nr:hypothetical protein [Clostridiales bacterium]
MKKYQKIGVIVLSALILLSGCYHRGHSRPGYTIEVFEVDHREPLDELGNAIASDPSVTRIEYMYGKASDNLSIDILLSKKLEKDAMDKIVVSVIFPALAANNDVFSILFSKKVYASVSFSFRYDEETLYEYSTNPDLSYEVWRNNLGGEFVLRDFASAPFSGRSDILSGSVYDLSENIRFCDKDGIVYVYDDPSIDWTVLLESISPVQVVDIESREVLLPVWTPDPDSAEVVDVFENTVNAAYPVERFYYGSLEKAGQYEMQIFLYVSDNLTETQSDQLIQAALDELSKEDVRKVFQEDPEGKEADACVIQIVYGHRILKRTTLEWK